MKLGNLNIKVEMFKKYTPDEMADIIYKEKDADFFTGTLLEYNTRDFLIMSFPGHPVKCKDNLYKISLGKNEEKYLKKNFPEFVELFKNSRYEMDNPNISKEDFDNIDNWRLFYYSVGLDETTGSEELRFFYDDTMCIEDIMKNHLKIFLELCNIKTFKELSIEIKNIIENCEDYFECGSPFDEEALEDLDFSSYTDFVMPEEAELFDAVNDENFKDTLKD